MTNFIKVIKKEINKRPYLNINQMMKKIQEFDYVSFDIFDTLIKRNLPEPEDVFTLVKLKYEKYSGIQLENFKRLRIEAERNARCKAGKGEVSLRNIYKEIAELDDDSKELLIDLEREVEKDVCCINVELISLFNWCIKNGKKVFLISDMYLDKDIIKKILDNCGVKGFNKLYVSSTYDKTKRSGELYKLVLAEQKIVAKQLIHIGDSMKNDVESAQKLNIATCKVPRYINRIKKASPNKISTNERFQYECLNSFLNNNEPIECSQYYKFGYEAFGMFLWGFSNWLLKDLREKNINKVYFFSRDGFIMKQVFDLINSDKNLNTYYLEVSRRSLRVPILWMDLELNTLLDMLAPSSLISLVSIIDGIGLSIDDYKERLQDFGLNIDSKFYRSNILENKGLNEFYNSIKQDISRQSEIEYNSLRKYLEQNQFEGNVAIVDIGWSGGMQRYLMQSIEKIGIKANIYGYYTGIASYVKRNTIVLPMNLKGYLFDFNNNSNSVDLRSSFVGLFETLFLEQNGSVKNYSEVNGTVYANRYDYEYIINGERAAEANYVQEIQQGALDFVKKIKKYKSINLFEFSAISLFHNIKLTGSSPNKQDLKLFGDFRFFDEGEISYLAKPKSIFFYLKRPRRLMLDFLECRWKVGFMKRLFKLPLPYQKIYQLLIYFK